MITVNGIHAFGWADFMPYDVKSGDWEELKKVKNRISRNDVLRRIGTLRFGAAARVPTVIKETGDIVECGKYVDGNFIFPAEFVYYYERGIVGIPKEYEEYLNGIRNPCNRQFRNHEIRI